MQRISHILHVQKKTILTTIAAIVLIVAAVVFCLTDPVGNMGEDVKNSEQEIAEQEPATKLYEAANPYIGDNSADGTLWKAISEYLQTELLTGTVELHTTMEPYTMTLHLDGAPEDTAIMWKGAALFIALTKNCGGVEWDYIEGNSYKTFTLWKEDVDAALDIDDVKDYAESEKEVEKLLTLLVNAKPKVQMETIYFANSDSREVWEYLQKLPADSKDALADENVFWVGMDIGKDRHYELWDAFYDKVKKESAARIVLAFSTVEGDVIYQYLSYDGKEFYLAKDNSRDEWAASGDLFSEWTYSHLTMDEKEEKDRTYYTGVLSNEEEESSQILFEFSVKNEE